MGTVAVDPPASNRQVSGSRRTARSEPVAGLAEARHPLGIGVGEARQGLETSGARLRRRLSIT